MVKSTDRYGAKSSIHLILSDSHRLGGGKSYGAKQLAKAGLYHTENRQETRSNHFSEPFAQ